MLNCESISQIKSQICIVYSSVTGNTKQIADALATQLDLPLFAVDDRFNKNDYSIFALGFWVKRGLPDCGMQRFIEQLHNKQVFFFCTHAAWPNSEHIIKCRERVIEMLINNQNKVIGYFNCQGRVRTTTGGTLCTKHPMTAERLVRLEEAKHHPNEFDLHNAVISFTQALAVVRS